MLLEYFNLNRKPFQLIADPRFLYLAEQHKKSLENLKNGILNNRGVLVLTGDVGTGKTSLVHALVEALRPDVYAAVIPDPSLEEIDLFNFIGHTFRMWTECRTRSECLVAFNVLLKSLLEKSRKALLVLDEAQRLTPNRLEQVQLLSNLASEGTKLLNILLVGQNAFDALLQESPLRDFTQQITIRCHIEPLTPGEVSAYVHHRLKIAGCDQPLFDPPALERIFQFSSGYPCLINNLCDHCLLTAFVWHLKQVDAAMVNECAAELNLINPLPEAAVALIGPAAQSVPDRPAASDTPPPQVTAPIRPEQTASALAQSEPLNRRSASWQNILGKPAFLLGALVLLALAIAFNIVASRLPIQPRPMPAAILPDGVAPNVVSEPISPAATSQEAQSATSQNLNLATHTMLPDGETATPTDAASEQPITEAQPPIPSNGITPAVVVVNDPQIDDDQKAIGE
jgi:type II secretory pathway predicted ATPase ExeA